MVGVILVRSKIEIYLDVLTAIKIYKKPTKIMYAANLSWIHLMRVVNILIAQKMITTEVSHSSDKRTINLYFITQKGEDVLDHLTIGVRMIQEYTPTLKPMKVKKTKHEDNYYKPKTRTKRKPRFLPTGSQKISVLKLLKRGERFPVSRIVSYSLASNKGVGKVLEELINDGLISLEPNIYKRSKGDYVITATGRRFILRGCNFDDEGKIISQS